MISGLIKVNAWVNQWEMNVNLGLNKKGQEVIFSLNNNSVNNNSVKQAQFQKHLGQSIDFRKHLQNCLPR